MSEIDGEKMDSVKKTCTEQMSSKDFIMEPSIFSCLKRYFEAGGMPDEVVELLSDNYTAVAQTVNLLAEWLIMCGMSAHDVRDMVENHLKDLLIQHFDPERADRIFHQAGQQPSWLIEMIEHPKWRQLFYKLAEEYPDCLMLSLTIKLISDYGYQAEITNVSTACTQLEVFSRVLKTGLTNALASTGEEELEKNLPELAKMVCHAEHTYLYSQVVMSILSQEKKEAWSKLRRISQEIQKYARTKGHDVTHIILALSSVSNHPRAKQSIMSMLNKGQLNPGDVTVLHQLYSSSSPPPVNLIQLPLFLDLFVDSLFTTKGAKINPEHLHKYVYVLAYAASVSEKSNKGKRSIFSDELQATSKAIDHVHHLVFSAKGQAELLSEIKNLYNYIRYPVVGMGVLKWIDQTVSDSKYFEKQMDNTPLHLILLDEVVSCHPLLHRDALKILINLFEQTFSELETLIQLELKKTVLDRMVHLMSKGCVIPVVSYIKDCTDRQDTDASLIRYFVTEVLAIISPPYSSDFVHTFLPIIENESITGSVRNEEGNDPVSDFIVYCKSNFIMV